MIFATATVDRSLGLNYFGKAFYTSTGNRPKTIYEISLADRWLIVTASDHLNIINNRLYTISSEGK